MSFGTEDYDATEPVEVTSNRLDVNPTDGTAIFTVNIVVQGELTLTARRELVEYGAPIRVRSNASTPSTTWSW